MLTNKNEREIRRLEKEIRDVYDDYFREHYWELIDGMSEELRDEIEEINAPYNVSVSLDITYSDGIAIAYTVEARHDVCVRSGNGDPVVLTVESVKKSVDEIAKSLFIALQIKLEDLEPKDNSDLVCDIERDRSAIESLHQAEAE